MKVKNDGKNNLVKFIKVDKSCFYTIEKCNCSPGLFCDLSNFLTGIYSAGVIHPNINETSNPIWLNILACPPLLLLKCGTEFANAKSR